ncbi:MAG: FAD:protein FMN transferase [Polaromonas sp.]|nr:FAD:protein FMN transferase [Polaromonas sp.]
MTRSPRLNKGRRRLLVGLPLLATALFLKPALADPRVRQTSRSLMGTRVDITVQARSGDIPEAAMAAAFTEMARLSDLMSRYRVSSAVSALHLAAGLQPVAMAPEMMHALKMARHMSERSQGAFDITVGAFHGWNFDPAQTTIPDAAEIARELPLVNYRDLILDEKSASAYLRRRGMRVDLGGIAKLPILQAGMQVLKRHGIADAMINGGGDVLVSGQLQGRDWRVGLRDSRAPERIVGVLDLNEGFVAASGDYERCFVRNGQRYHHILDPKSGQPSLGPHGVTLVSRKLEDINGLGAAIMVAGAETGRHLLEPLKGVDALIVESDQRLWLSPGMAKRLHA